ncbi:MAG: ferredoxin-dependent glutamate synthase [Myxococcaceae bacterium]|nr:ferredoxin-dependent glutamate synthase [Myxococcaceae bacterium]
MTHDDELIAFLSTQRLGPHSDGMMASMGMPWRQLPSWDDLEIVERPSTLSGDDSAIGTTLVLGASKAKPLRLAIPLIVSDMSFGSLSMAAKIALAAGAESAGTAICSGEGGILAEEIAESHHYIYELGSGEFGFAPSEFYPTPLWHKAQAFHFKGGQAAKTGTGGHLPAEKVTQRIARTRGRPVGEAIISPPTFTTMRSVRDFKDRIDQVQEKLGGVPIGFKLSANHIRADIDFALEMGVDYIILDGRGGSTGAAPILFRDHISIPTIPALVEARQVLDQRGASGRVKLIATGSLRVPTDFVKALALGADGIALANAALQAVGCIGTRQCHTNLCPTGIATQDPYFTPKFTGKGEQLRRFLANSVRVMQRIARQCGHATLSDFTRNDLETPSRELARLTGVRHAG